MINFSAGVNKMHIIQLVRGEYLLEEICKVIEKKKIKNAAVVAGLGTLENFTVHSVVTTTFPVENKWISVKNQPIGVSAMNGFVANYQPHIHMAFSVYNPDGTMYTYTGHLENDCKVLCRMEVVLIEAEGLELERILDENGIEVLSPV